MAPPSVMDLEQAFALHLEAVKSENRSPKTLLLYEGRYRQFMEFLGEHGAAPPFALELLSAANLRQAAIWIRERSKGKHGGAAAARALVSTLKTASAWLTDESVLPDDPLARVKRPQAPAGARMPFTQEEVRALAVAAAGSRAATRDVAIIHLLLDTGMRVGGLCSIQVADLDLTERRLELRLKGGRRQAVYFGSGERRDGGHTLRALRAYLRDREAIVTRWPTHHQGRLFLGFDGWPLAEGGVRAIFGRLSAASGVQHVYPHKFRHSFASLYLVRHPGDETGLRGALGHLSDSMYQVYAHVAHEIIAQRAGRVSLAEAWLGSGQESDEPAPVAQETTRPPRQTQTQADTRQALLDAVRGDPALRKELLAALIGAG